MTAYFLRRIAGVLIAMALMSGLEANLAGAANQHETRIRCDSKPDAEACLEVGVADMRRKEKAYKKAAARALKRACSIQLKKAVCTKEEVKNMVTAYIDNKSRVPANAKPQAILAPKIQSDGKRTSFGGGRSDHFVPPYEPPPQPAPVAEQPPPPPEPAYMPPPQSMPPPPPQFPMATGSHCMPGDPSCMQPGAMGP